MSRFVIELRDTDPRHQSPPEVRLRQLLKIALRGFGLRCTSIESKDEERAPSCENDLVDSGQRTTPTRA